MPSSSCAWRHKSASPPKSLRYPLDQANQALADLRDGRFEGAAVLVP